MEMAPGVKEEADLRAAGFTDQEITADRVEKVQKWRDAGFSDKEIGEHYGDKEMNKAPLEEYFKRNIASHNAELAGKEAPNDRSSYGPNPLREAQTFAETIEAGWQMGIASLARDHKQPDLLPPEHLGTFYRTASQIATMAGDFASLTPVVGAIAGAAAAPGGAMGKMIGAGAGAMALPTAVRGILMDSYKNGEVKSFEDFWERSSAIFLQTAKDAVVGGLTAGVGGQVGKIVGATAMPKILQAGSVTVAEIATMVGVGKGLEGQVPEPQDFLDAGVLIAGMHVGMKMGKHITDRVSGKLMNIYKETGNTPADVAMMAEKDPTIQQDLLSSNIEFPRALQIGEAPKELIPPKGFDTTKTYFHGTGKDFTEFKGDTGFYFSENPKLANWAADNMPARRGESEPNPNVRQVFLKMENPLTVTAAEAKEMGFNAAHLTSEDIAMLKGKGYDGLIYGEETVVFDSSQIRDRFAQPQKIEMKPSAAMLEQNPNLQPEPQVKLEIEPMPKAPQDPPPPPTSDDHAFIRSRIAPYEEKKVKLTWDQIYTRAKDFDHPLNVFEDLAMGKKIVDVPYDKRPYILMRQTKGAAGRIDQFLELGTYDFHNMEQRTGPSMKEVLEPVKHELDRFEEFATATHALELEDHGIDSGIAQGTNGKPATPEQRQEAVLAAARVFKQDRDKYGKILGDLVDFQNRAIKYLKDSGAISPADEKNLINSEHHQFHVPFNRLVEAGKKSASGKGGVYDPLKAMHGSEKMIMAPLTSIMKNIQTFIALAEHQRVVGAMIEMAKNNTHLMNKEKPHHRAITVKEKELGNFLEQHYGIKNNDHTLTVFITAGLPLKENQIVYINEGVREVWNVDPEVANTIKGIDGREANLLFDFMGKFATTVRVGSTTSPDFAIRNIFKDQIMAYVTSGKYGFIPFYDTAVALGSVFKKDETYQRWLKSGGANATLVAPDINNLYRNFFHMNKDAGLLDTAKNVLKTPWEMLKVTSELMENATRVAVFKRALGEGRTNADLIKAGYASREATVDFARQGAGNARAMNSITAFYNAHLEGMDRTVRAAMENPGRFAAVVFATITLPSLLSWYANKDDPRWQEIPRWQKDLAWIIMTKDHVYRIPKPPEIGWVFGSLPERMMEKFFTDHPNALNDLGESFLAMFIPSFIPNFFSNIIDFSFNTSTFTGQPIIPQHLDGLIPVDKYTEYTSESAKQLGNIIGHIPILKNTDLASPMMIEHSIKGWTGSMGGYALKLADMALEKAHITPDPRRPDDTLADMPIVKAFAVRYPSASSQSILDFYHWNEEVHKRGASIKHAMSIRDFDKVNTRFSDAQIENALAPLDTVKQAIAVQADMARKIYRDPATSPTDKRKAIDQLYNQMIQKAQFGLKMARDIDQIFENNKKGR